MKPGVEYDLEEDIKSPPSMKLRPHESGLTAILPLPGSTVRWHLNTYIHNTYTDLYT